MMKVMMMMMMMMMIVKVIVMMVMMMMVMMMMISWSLCHSFFESLCMYVLSPPSLLSFQVPLISTAISCRDMRIECLALAWLQAGMHCAQVLYVRHPSDCTYYNTYFMFMNDMIID